MCVPVIADTEVSWKVYFWLLWGYYPLTWADDVPNERSNYSTVNAPV